MARALLALAVPCVLLLVALAAAAWIHRDEIVTAGTRGIGIERALLPRFERWVDRLEGEDRQRVVLFGDSLLMGGEAGPDGGPRRAFRLAKEYRNDLRERRVYVAAFTLAHVAFRPIHLYYLLDEIATADPDLVIIGINLRIFSPAGSYPAGRFLNLSRKLSLARQFQLREGLQEEGVGVFDPAVYRLQEETGTLYMPDGVRAIGHEWLLAAGNRASKALGARSQWNVPRLTRAVALRTYDVDPSIHPQAAIAAAIRKRLRASGVSVLFYVSPINPGPLESLGLLDQLDLSDRIDALQDAIGARPQEWLNLYDRLPAREFRDFQNHLKPSGLEFVSNELAAATTRTLALRRRMSRRLQEEAEPK